MSSSAKELRKLYVEATLSQRFDVALQRVENPCELGPDRLVAAVSALEGFSRSLAVEFLVRGGGDRWEAYNTVKHLGPLALLEKHVLPVLGEDPSSALFHDLWPKVDEAIQFRNLVVHESTYLALKSRDELADAAIKMFNLLGKLSGVGPETKSAIEL